MAMSKWEARVHGYLIRHFRLAWRYYSENRRQVLREGSCVGCDTVACAPRENCNHGTVSTRGRKRKRKCSLQADHVDPVVSTKKGFQGWDEMYKRMFHGKLQALCLVCHQKKSKAENKLRRKK